MRRMQAQIAALHNLILQIHGDALSAGAGERQGEEVSEEEDRPVGLGMSRPGRRGRGKVFVEDDVSEDADARSGNQNVSVGEYSEDGYR